MNKELLYQKKKIFYRSYGAGQSVMLVHGFGEDGNVWNRQVDFLKDECQLIVPDLPGSGQSEIISDMSMEGMAEVLHAIIHEEMPPQAPPKEGFANSQNQYYFDTTQKENGGIKESSKFPTLGGGGATCTMIGHSMGGYITMAFAEKYWNHLHAFGLVHSTAFADSEEKKITRNKGIDFIKQHGAFEFLYASIPNLFSLNFKKENPEIIKGFINAQSGFSAEALIEYYQAMMQRPDRTNILINAEVPVLFVAGENDAAIPLGDSLKQSHLAEKCFFHLLKKSGHMGMLEETQKVNQILKEFLRETKNEAS